jgi:hypothetical protein
MLAFKKYNGIETLHSIVVENEFKFTTETPKHPANEELKDPKIWKSDRDLNMEKPYMKR